jgi:hypothetical protein
MMHKRKVFVIALTSAATPVLSVRNNELSAVRKRRHLEGKSSKADNQGDLFQHYSQITATKLPKAGKRGETPESSDEEANAVNDTLNQTGHDLMHFSASILQDNQHNIFEGDVTMLNNNTNTTTRENALQRPFKSNHTANTNTNHTVEGIHNESNSTNYNVFDSDVSKISDNDDTSASSIFGSNNHDVASEVMFTRNETTRRIQYGLIFSCVGLVAATVALLLIKSRRSRAEQALEVYRASMCT